MKATWSRWNEDNTQGKNMQQKTPKTRRKQTIRERVPDHSSHIHRQQISLKKIFLQNKGLITTDAQKKTQNSKSSKRKARCLMVVGLRALPREEAIRVGTLGVTKRDFVKEIKQAVLLIMRLQWTQLMLGHSKRCVKLPNVHAKREASKLPWFHLIPSSSPAPES